MKNNIDFNKYGELKCKTYNCHSERSEESVVDLFRQLMNASTF
jgi:hypothetical protein